MCLALWQVRLMEREHGRELRLLSWERKCKLGKRELRTEC